MHTLAKQITDVVEVRKITKLEQFYQRARKFEFGLDVEKDVDKAVIYYTKAARKGHVEAQFSLGVISATEEDLEDACYWWHKASENGHQQAQFNIIIAYLEGLGVDKNTDQAIALMQKASIAGNGKIEYLLAREYYLGKNVPRNFEQAASHYLGAAKMGIANAINDLGMMYAMGQVGGKAKPMIAYGLGKTALGLGYKSAQRTLSATEKTFKLSEQDKLKATKLAKELLRAKH
jgi:TPR repeat protein